MQAELDASVGEPLVHLVVHDAGLDVTGQRLVLIAEHARAAALLVPDATDADVCAHPHEPAEAQLELHHPAEQRVAQDDALGMEVGDDGADVLPAS